VVRGQNTISHPNGDTSGGGGGGSKSAARVVDKSGDHPPLPSPIRRVFYLSHEGTGQEHEVYPPPNPRSVRAFSVRIYYCGVVQRPLTLTCFVLLPSSAAS